MPCDRDSIYFCYQDLSTVEIDLSTSLRLLSPDEIARAGRMRFGKDHKSFVLRRAILRRLIANFLSLDPSKVVFGYGPFGKPYLPHFPEFHFNLSFSGDHVCYAFTEGFPLGVDVERIRSDVECLRIADHFFSVEEKVHLRALPKAELPPAFYRCWTRKEAIIKAMGDGLNYPLREFAVSVKSDASIVAFHDPREEVSAWHLLNVYPDLNDFTIALAYRGAPKAVEMVTSNKY